MRAYFYTLHMCVHALKPVQVRHPVSAALSTLRTTMGDSRPPVRVRVSVCVLFDLLGASLRRIWRAHMWHSCERRKSEDVPCRNQHRVCVCVWLFVNSLFSHTRRRRQRRQRRRAMSQHPIPRVGVCARARVCVHANHSNRLT